MQFRFGPPPNSLSDSDLISGKWKALRELPFWLFQLCALLAGALGSVAVLIFWIQFGPAFTPDFGATWQIIVAMLAVLCTGMALQVAAHPGYGFTRKSTMGIWPSRFTPYTYFNGIVSKRRYIFSLLLPVTVSVVLPFFAAMLSSRFSGWLTFISCCGAFSFGIGPFLALSAAVQLPANARVAGRGLKIFWRHYDIEA
jgi:hypothetical protein